jgi:xylose isomerase
MDVKSTTLAMDVVLRNGGMGTGGLNFDAKVRRESTDLDDMFISHIGGMDAFSRGLLNASRMVEDKAFSKPIAARYSSYDSGIGKAIESGEADFKALEKWVLDAGEPTQASGKQERYESILNDYT